MNDCPEQRHDDIGRLRERVAIVEEALRSIKEAVNVALISAEKNQQSMFVTIKELDAVIEKVRNDRRADFSIWISLFALLIGGFGFLFNFLKQ